MSLFRLFKFLLLNYFFISIICDTCTNEEYEYQFTKCNFKNERWRIALPKEKTKTCDNLPKPTGGLNCSFSCNSGQYLSLTTLQCAHCEPGSYSLGDGVRYETFDKQLPSDFTVDNYPNEHSSIFTTTLNDFESTCTNGWVVQSGGLRYIPSPCISRLSISVHVIRSGYIEFIYKMPKNMRGIHSSIDVRDEQCQRVRDPAAFLFDQNRKGQDSGQDDFYNKKRIQLKRGQSTITWTVTNNIEMTTLADVIYVIRIDIYGIAYTTSCNHCQAGTFARVSGSSICESCPENTFSKAGSNSCTNCPYGSYAPGKSGTCLSRPKCTENDYHLELSDVCFKNAGYQHKYVKTQPEICQNGLDVPPIVQKAECPNCPLGFGRNSNNGKCEYCGSGTFSGDGISCKKCVDKQAPKYGFYWNKWNSIPDVIETACEYNNADYNKKCPLPRSWIAGGEYFETAKTRELGVMLEFFVNVTAGFDNPLLSSPDAATIENPIAEISFDLELNCIDQSCILYFVEDTSLISGSSKIIATFDGTVKRKVFRHPILGTKGRRFIFGFMRSGAPDSMDSIEDYARIYSLNITNVKTKHGAASCIPCPKINDKGDCVPCPVGSFVNTLTSVCESCLPGTIIVQKGHESGCQKCPENMISEDFKVCKFNDQISFGNGSIKIDLKPIKAHVFNTTGVKVYATDGNPYYHFFNVSLGSNKIKCREDDNYGMNIFKYFPKNEVAKSGSEETFVDERDMAVICVSTAVTYTEVKKGNTSKAQNSIFYTSPIAIAQKLEKVTQDRAYDGLLLTNEDLEYNEEGDAEKFIDTHLYFSATNFESKTCPNGTRSVITVRCKSDSSEPVLRLSKGCPDGTCNGCLYHMFIETKYACPICELNNYQEIRGECVEGKQLIHFIPSKNCVLSGAIASVQKLKCSNISQDIKMAIGFIFMLIFTLLSLVVYIYKKGKNIEYKYMRLVAEKSGKGFQMPIAETCGIDSDDTSEDEEDKELRETMKGKVFFKSSGSSGKSNDSVKLGGITGNKNQAFDTREDIEEDLNFDNVSLDERNIFIS
uniref:Ephrin_rec_like domain-containing protein n=1 Tax=Rhabditophanes sp. KR3021 TaxID=114890 RepID=A0AC35TLM1_9BILA